MQKLKEKYFHPSVKEAIFVEFIFELSCFPIQYHKYEKKRKIYFTLLTSSTQAISLRVST